MLVKPGYQRPVLMAMLKSSKLTNEEKSAVRWAITVIDNLRSELHMIRDLQPYDPELTSETRS